MSWSFQWNKEGLLAMFRYFWEAEHQWAYHTVTKDSDYGLTVEEYEPGSFIYVFRYKGFHSTQYHSPKGKQFSEKYWDGQPYGEHFVKGAIREIIGDVFKAGIKYADGQRLKPRPKQEITGGGPYCSCEGKGIGIEMVPCSPNHPGCKQFEEQNDVLREVFDRWFSDRPKEINLEMLAFDAHVAGCGIAEYLMRYVRPKDIVTDSRYPSLKYFS